MDNDHFKSPEERAAAYRHEAMLIAQDMSGLWKQLPADASEREIKLTDDPDLWSIDQLAEPKGGKSGIQRHFDSKVAFIEQQTDPEAQGRMFYRLKEEFEGLRKKLLAVLQG